jgi:DNA repair ATPase RecN
MSDADKILEAEQSIQGIATELKRMRDAANLLQDSQEKTETILNAANRVIKVTEEFSVACGDIVRKLSATDLNQRLDTVQGGMNQISGLVNEQAKKTIDAIATTESKLAELNYALQAVAKESKKRHTISIVLIILTLATAFTAFIATLLRGIGG